MGGPSIFFCAHSSSVVFTPSNENKGGGAKQRDSDCEISNASAFDGRRKEKDKENGREARVSVLAETSKNDPRHLLVFILSS